MREAALRGAVDGAVATITIDNPAKRNVMTGAMWRQLPVLLDGLAADPAVRVVVLTGAGDTFCAGADISELAEGGDGPKYAVFAEEALAAFPKPVIASITGYCVGGGCQLAVACDLRFAADDARFGITPAKLGIVYPPYALRRLSRLVGPATAKYLLYSADLIDAGRALRTGLVDETMPAAGLPARVAEFAATLAARSQLTIHAAKDIVDAAELTEEHVRRWAAEAATCDDAAEGARAFLERRQPRFTWTGGPIAGKAGR